MESIQSARGPVAEKVSPTEILPSLDEAIARGRSMVLSRQRDDGSFQERGDMGPFTTALALVSLHHVGKLSPAEILDGARWLRASQRDDGSFPGRPFAAEGDLSTTAVCWAALSLSTHPDDAVAAARARAHVQSRGGIAAVAELSHSGDVSAHVLAMAGLLDPRNIHAVPLSVTLVPGLVELLSRRVVFYGLSTMLASSLIARGLASDKKRGFFRDLVEARERSRAVDLLTLYQNDNGSLMNVVYHTALLVPALAAAGLPSSDPRLARAIEWLRGRGARDEQGLFFDVYGSDVWSTACYLRVLLATGSERDSWPVVRAVTWLLAQQCNRPHPALTNPKPGAPRVGGWGFQSGERAYPDCDTTSTVLDALGRALLPEASTDAPLPPPLAARVCAAIASARAWLAAMQNPDGGWPSFFWGHPEKRPGPMMMRAVNLRFGDVPAGDPTAWVRAIAEASEHLSDPSTEDVTSRVLMGLSRTGTTSRAPEAQSALEFLSRQQCPTGAFWGRWKVNYLPATAGVVSALARLGDDLDKEMPRRALAWIEGCQNEDGGFGESVDSYRDPRLAGKGSSTSPLTGSVLQGLVEGGLERSASSAAAAAYLLREQRPDGSWPNGDCVATLVPPTLFYVYGGSCRYIPLEALACYRGALARARDNESRS